MSDPSYGTPPPPLSVRPRINRLVVLVCLWLSLLVAELAYVNGDFKTVLAVFLAWCGGVVSTLLVLEVAHRRATA